MKYDSLKLLQALAILKTQYPQNEKIDSDAVHLKYNIDCHDNDRPSLQKSEIKLYFDVTRSKQLRCVPFYSRLSVLNFSHTRFY